MLTQQWTGQHGDSSHQDRFRGEQELEIGSTVLHLTLKVFTSPDPSDTPVIVIAGDHKNRAGHGTHHLQHLHHRGRGNGAGIKQIPCHQNRVDRLLTHNLGDAPDHFNALLLQASLFLAIVDPAVRLADLPISCVENPWHQRR